MTLHYKIKKSKLTEKFNKKIDFSQVTQIYRGRRRKTHYHYFWCGNDEILAQCWANVCDAGPTLSQHWFNVSCLLGRWEWQTSGALSSQLNIRPTLSQRWHKAGPSLPRYPSFAPALFWQVRMLPGGLADILMWHAAVNQRITFTASLTAIWSTARLV